MQTHDYTFRAATPVWEKGTAQVMNQTVCFCADLPAPAADSAPVVVAAAASCAFVLLVNGVYVAHGPARCAHGFFRVDEYDLTPYLTQKVNRVALRTAGYNVNSFSYLNQPSFLCAEILCGEDILAATGKSGFTAYHVDERLTRVPRYSFQRTFAEVYRLAPGSFDYEVNPATAVAPVETVAAKAGHFLHRDIPYNDIDDVYPTGLIHRGKVSYSDKAEYMGSRYIRGISDRFLGYREEEQEYAAHQEVGKCDFSGQVDVQESAQSIDLPANTFADLEFPCNTTGIYEFDIDADADGELFIIYDEILLDGEVKCFRLDIMNVLTVQYKAGKYHLQCVMPLVMKYARLVAKDAHVRIDNLRIHHIAYPASIFNARFIDEDETMRRIYDAAIESYRSNSVDIYMDCPSRERAGWLCDSFFTSRVEYVLTGQATLERAFLQNFILPDRFECLPEGMLPMCYPADHYDGVFIPNWSMWYGLELCEYVQRTGDKAFAEDCKETIYNLLGYFKKLENEYGLLENLQGWVFLEWSKSNELVQDVSFASNMLYARLHADLGKLYGDAALIEKGETLRQTIRDMAMTESGFFCDNALRRDGKLVLSGERTESCQYYAFFCDIATPETYPELWNTLVKDFDYNRQSKGLYPEIHPANAFVGNYLRLDLLKRYGLHNDLYDNIKGYFTYMADQTGTLWENVGAYASCNHGFASHVIYWMDKIGLIAHD